MNNNQLKNLFDSSINSVKPKSNVGQKEFEDLMFILSNEFHWTQKDIQETDLPFVFEVLNARKRMFDEQERQAKRRR
jgi:hypothetical protein